MDLSRLLCVCSIHLLNSYHMSTKGKKIYFLLNITIAWDKLGKVFAISVRH